MTYWLITLTIWATVATYFAFAFAGAYFRLIEDLRHAHSQADRAMEQVDRAHDLLTPPPPGIVDYSDLENL